MAGSGLFVQTMKAQHSPISALFLWALILVLSGVSKKGIYLFFFSFFFLFSILALTIFRSSWNTDKAPSLY